MARNGGQIKGFPDFEPNSWGPGKQDKQQVELEKLRKTGKVVTFPFADGFAYYFIKSERPLILQHIPYGDAYQIPAAHLRGLRLEDIQARQDRTSRGWHF